MEGQKADWVFIGEIWQMRGLDGNGNECCVKFTIVDRDVYREEGKESGIQGAKVRLEDGTETVLSLAQFAYFERLDS